LKRRGLAVLCLLAVCTGAHGAPPPTPAPATGSKIRSIIDSLPDTGQFLPDTVVLASVNDRVIRVGEFIDRYFKSYAEFRPPSDSTGRVEFLNSMIKKEVIGNVARRANRTESFEDRIVMREHTERVLSNVLFRRAVLDSVVEPSEEAIRRIYAQTGFELHLQVIVNPDLQQAERVRRDLVGRRITWRDAARRFSAIRADSFPDGDLGWRRRDALDARVATAVFDLAALEISRPLQQYEGYAIYRALERRSIPLLSYSPMRTLIRDELRGLQIAERGERIFAVLRARSGMAHDSTNIAWAASRFKRAVTMSTGPRPTIDIDQGVPQFEPADTSRVLGRWSDGQLTVGGFLAAYAATSVFERPNVTTLEGFHNQVDVFALEPYRADLARSRGLEKDSLAITMIERRREELMAEHLYQDSILSKVLVTRAERQKYYQRKVASFVTVPKVTYFRFHTARRSEADSIAARLRAGEKAEEVMRRTGRGSIEERNEEEQGTPYYSTLFGELRPGQVAIEPTDYHGGVDVVQLRSYDPGRQMSYQEAEAQVDEDLQNLAAEKLLNAFLERHRRTMRIVSHPELVMGIRLVAPTF
jgi:parvulin-like peptidyl-prolyl cis-trans isomerase-like protein/PPIC-type peptidyl-prolyl cis-trans isomerase-like protein